MNSTGVFHKDLAKGAWAEMSLVEQLANIGSEIHRTTVWMAKGMEERKTLAFYRALELIDFSIKSQKRTAALIELCRLREYFCGLVLDNNLSELQSLDKSMDAWGLAYSRMRNV